MKSINKLPARPLAILLLIALLLPMAASAELVSAPDFREILDEDPKAEYVNFSDTVIDSLDDFIAIAQKMPNLKKVDMFATPVNADQIAQLEAALPDVKFGWTMTIACSNPAHPERKFHYIRTDATAFSTLHNSRCRVHSSEDFAILKYCENLLGLDIGHNKVDDLSFLEYLPKLRVLIIGRNNITDLSPIRSCPDLEYLEAFTNSIESVEPLLSCPRLMDLNIPNNRIKDPELFAQMTSLRRLWAFNYAWRTTNRNYVPEDIKKLVKEALPDCVVNFRNSGTNGWRENTDHYAVIYEMFNTGVYVPFAESAPLE